MESTHRQNYLTVTNPSLPPLRNSNLGRNDIKKVSKRMKRSRIATALFLSNTIIQNPGVSAFTVGNSGAFNSVPEAIATRRIPSKDSSHFFALDALSFDNPPSDMSDFQKRMRNLVSTAPSKVGKRRPRRNENVPDNLLVIDTLEEFKNLIQGNDDKIIVVRFYAPWCKVRLQRITLFLFFPLAPCQPLVFRFLISEFRLARTHFFQKIRSQRVFPKINRHAKRLLHHSTG